MRKLSVYIVCLGLLVVAGVSLAQAAFGTLRFSSNPSGATVYVDGSFVGYTPMSLGTRPGVHNVRIELEGYEPFTARVNLRPGDTSNVTANLNPVLGAGRPAQRLLIQTSASFSMLPVASATASAMSA